MTSTTEHFGLTKLGPSEGIHAGDDRFASADRDLIDQQFNRFATHNHTGAGALDSPDTAPDLDNGSSGGTLGAGTTFRYVYTILDPESGETAPSPVATFVTSNAITAPDAPTYSQQTIGGTLEPGQYFYVLSAYDGATTVETKAVNPVSVLIPAGTSTNEVTLTMPSVPSGADGFNIYRRSPGGGAYWWIASTTGSSYVDGGDSDTARGLPPENTTNALNSIDISVPGATPSIPAGSSWRIYRSTTATFKNNSFLVQLDENTLTYEDVGGATTSGGPPQDSFTAEPSKIDLQDAAEIQGQLPLGMIIGLPQTKEFSFPGAVETATGSFKWPIMFPEIEILGVKAALGVGSTPASTDVIVDVNKWDSTLATPASATMFTTQGNRPTISVGDEESSAAVPDVVSAVDGDYLTVDIDQAGGGATPTDEDLIVTIYYMAKFTSTVTETIS